MRLSEMTRFKLVAQVYVGDGKSDRVCEIVPGLLQVTGYISTPLFLHHLRFLRHKLLNCNSGSEVPVHTCLCSQSDRVRVQEYSFAWKKRPEVLALLRANISLLQ